VSDSVKLTDDTKIERDRQPRYVWVVMGVLWCMDVMTPLTVFSIGVLLPDWTRDLAVTPFQAGLLGSVGFLGFGVMALPSSIWLTRYNPRLVVLLCALGMAASISIQAVATTVGMLLLSRFIFVLFAVSRIQVQIIFLQQWFKPRLYAVANSIEFGNRAAGQAASVALVPILVVLLGGWRMVYLVFAALLVGFSVLWVFLGRERKAVVHPGESAAQSGNPIGVLRRHKVLWLVTGSQIGAAMTFASFMTFFPTYAVEKLGISLAAVGLLFSLFPVGAIAGALCAGPLSQWIGKRKPFIWIPGIVLPVVWFALLQFDQVPILIMLLLVGGACAMAVPPILATIPLDMGLAPREVAVALGLMRTLFPLGATTGPILVGMIEERTGSLELGLMIMAPLALSLFIAGILLPETGPTGALKVGRSTRVN
jgi:predicted MFS family arabinose efflux permease